MNKTTYKDYVKWFTNQFNCHPTDTYHMVNVIDELIAFRSEYQDKIPRPNILDYTEPEEVERMLDVLKIITFEEYKNMHI
jgi:hypothetical protein